MMEIKKAMVKFTNEHEGKWKRGYKKSKKLKNPEIGKVKWNALSKVDIK